MENVSFIKKLNRGKNCYADHMSTDELQLIHITSRLESIIPEMLDKGKIIFLTGNPGDGKTFIIKALDEVIKRHNAFVETDANNQSAYNDLINNIISCYDEGRPAIIAINEYPFLQLRKQMKEASTIIFDEIIVAKKNAITYDTSFDLKNRIVVIDLNERNLLDPDNHIISTLFDRFIELLRSQSNPSRTLSYNLKALSIPEIKNQVLSLFQLVATECEHFAVRDILGAFSFFLTACETDDYENERYYSAIFTGDNILLKAIQQFDPIYLSLPELDEKLWNGEISLGWIIEAPTQWPCSNEFDDSPEEALACFKEIKRRYYFENVKGLDLVSLQPSEINECARLFTSYDTQKKKTKERFVRAINKLFLPSLEDKRQLHIWTTHRYDISISAPVAVSSKAVDSSELELLMPRPADWLKGLEYLPDHFILRPKNATTPSLRLDIDFIRTLIAVEKGYPINLLASHYEQAASRFLRELDSKGFSEENDDGEIIIADRSQSNCFKMNIQDDKYGFSED